MPRELRISAVIPLPDGDFEEAAAICAVRPVLDDLRQRIGETGKVTHEIVTPRPRGEKGGETA